MIGMHEHPAIAPAQAVNPATSTLRSVTLWPLVGCFDELQFDVSFPRNPKLAAVFYRLMLIEAYGTGIRRMFAARLATVGLRDCAGAPRGPSRVPRVTSGGF